VIKKSLRRKSDCLLGNQDIYVRNALELLQKRSICVSQINYTEIDKNRIMKLLLFAILFMTGCSDHLTNPEEFESIDVDIRMEIQVLDSTFQIYSRPLTKIYFTTYKLTKSGTMVNFDQTDTTSCPNGWGVKLLNFRFNNSDERIILGAASEKYDGPNYREVEIDYTETERRIDSVGHASIIKTFAIYYK
jgi:hypothetical protein